MKTFRTLKVYGNRSQDLEYEVTVNGNIVDTSKEELYSFVTSTDFHGGIDVCINVKKGFIIIQNITATYPAEINGIDNKSVTMIQPIAEPVAVIENNELQTLPFPIMIKEHKFSYKHLMFNGPTKWLIKTKTYPQVDNFYLGDLLQKDYNPSLDDFDVIYDYLPSPNDVWNLNDLELLKRQVL